MAKIAAQMSSAESRSPRAASLRAGAAEDRLSERRLAQRRSPSGARLRSVSPRGVSRGASLRAVYCRGGLAEVVSPSGVSPRASRRAVSARGASGRSGVSQSSVSPRGVSRGASRRVARREGRGGRRRRALRVPRSTALQVRIEDTFVKAPDRSARAGRLPSASAIVTTSPRGLRG